MLIDNWHQNKPSQWHSRCKVNFVSLKWLHMVLVEPGRLSNFLSQLKIPHTGKRCELGFKCTCLRYLVYLLNVSSIFTHHYQMYLESLEVSMTVERLWGLGAFPVSSTSILC